MRRRLLGSDLQCQAKGRGPQPALEVGEGREVSSQTVPRDPVFTLPTRGLGCERGTEVLLTETWVFVSPGMRGDHPCLLGWGAHVVCCPEPPVPTSSCSFPSFKRRECSRGLQATLQSPLLRAEARQPAPVWSLIRGVTQKEENQIPGKKCAAGMVGWGGTLECRARAGRKLSKMLCEADRDISAALLFPFC